MLAKFDDSSFSRSRYIMGASKFKVGHVTLDFAPFTVTCYPYVGA